MTLLWEYDITVGDIMTLKDVIKNKSLFKSEPCDVIELP